MRHKFNVDKLVQAVNSVLGPNHPMGTSVLIDAACLYGNDTIQIVLATFSPDNVDGFLAWLEGYGWETPDVVGMIVHHYHWSL